jgi:hypothetical protein
MSAFTANVKKRIIFSKEKMTFFFYTRMTIDEIFL